MITKHKFESAKLASFVWNGETATVPAGSYLAVWQSDKMVYMDIMDEDDNEYSLAQIKLKTREITDEQQEEIDEIIDQYGGMNITDGVNLDVVLDSIAVGLTNAGLLK